MAIRATARYPSATALWFSTAMSTQSSRYARRRPSVGGLMRLRSAPLALLVLAGCQPPADQVFTNAMVYTADDAQPTAEAVAVTDGRIVFVGSAADAEIGRASCRERGE